MEPVREDSYLPLGGLFDFKTQWKPPHASHRFGNDADIGLCELTSQQRIALQAAVAAAGFGTPVSAESPAVDVCAPNGTRHWHLRLP